ILCMLCHHAGRHREGLACHGAVPRGDPRRAAHHRVRAVAFIVPAALLRIPGLTTKEERMDRRHFLKTGALAGATLAAPYVARAQSPLTLRWAHFAPEDHPANVAAKQFASRVETRTNGAIKVQI